MQSLGRIQSKNMASLDKKGRVKCQKMTKKEREMNKFEKKLRIMALILFAIAFLIYLATNGLGKTIKDSNGCFQITVDDSTENCIYCCKEFEVNYIKDGSCLLASN